MIRSAELGKEIVVTVINKIGVLADMTKILAEHGISIAAIAGYAQNSEAKIMLLTEDNQRAVDALKKNGYKGAEEKEVVVVELENKPGALKIATEKLDREDIDIKYLYGTTCVGGCAARLVFSTSDNEKALVAFKKGLLAE